MNILNSIEIYLKLIGGGICTFIITLLGGFDVGLKALILIIALDIITGILKAIYTKKLSSRKAWKGGIKKTCIFIMVVLGVAIDQFLGTQIFRNCAIGYYIASEGLSIIENLGQMDVPMPKKIIDILEQLQEKNNSEKNCNIKE